MKLCHKCNSKMVEVKLIDMKKRKYKALVCTYCGRFYSRDRGFLGEWKVG
ncbi:hypothetical protein [Clostridium sp. Cult1]|nr:hypothetical protein [Clostridium sp. Cult1]